MRAADRVRRLCTRPRRAVAALVVLAAVLRFPLLGDRVVHWDEARVGWWVLHYEATGSYRYQPILHGPFLFHVERWLVARLGPSAAVLRLPTAVVGSLLPAAALWYRDGLDDRETVALALLLAVAPLLVFYSRFMRNDLLLAAFAFAALGAGLRAAATGRRRYALAAAGLLALAFTTKENAVLYPVSWLGAAGLVYARRQWTAARGRPDRSAARAASREARERVAALRDWAATGLAGALVFLAVVVAFYAPRTAAPASGIDDLASSPGLLPGLAREATVGSARELVALWVLGDVGASGSVPLFFGILLAMLLALAPATLALAAYGAVSERARADGPRWLPAFALAWAGLGVVGYPFAVDFVAGWTVVHVVVPLTVPAAVGLADLVGRASAARSGTTGGDRSGRVATVALAVLAVQAVAVGGTATYAAPDAHWNPYPQPAQPGPEMGPTTDAVAAIAAEHPGADVAYVGDYFAEGLYARHPFPWHVRQAGGSAVVRESPSDLGADPPPVVVAPAADHEAVAPRLSGYVCFAHRLRPWTGRGPGDPPASASLTGREVTTHVYVDEDALDRYAGSTLSSQRCG